VVPSTVCGVIVGTPKAGGAVVEEVVVFQTTDCARRAAPKEIREDDSVESEGEVVVAGGLEGPSGDELGMVGGVVV
jgi:hypothetical protein